jgi:hypothetical protein
VPNSPRIELPRPAIIAALGALILVVTFVITKSGTDNNSTSTPAASSSSTTATTTTPSSSASTSTTTTSKPAPQPAQPPVQAGQGLPANVARALDNHKVVVLFFWEPASADDQATRAAVRAVRTAGPGVRLFTDIVAHISNYRRVVGNLGISQSPAMVVIDKQRHAQLFEGYLDAGSIRQSVRDAL